jgi:nucleotide-binding universal stress UspA family protein
VVAQHDHAAPWQGRSRVIAFKHILVPTDFGAASARACEIATDLAKQYEASLTLLHVFDVPASYPGMDLSPMDLLGPMREAAEEQLEAAIIRMRRVIPNANVIMARGVPWREILATIEQEHPDLVVVGTRGRGAIGRILVGSVAEKIVRLSPVPILTVHAAQ